MTLQPKFIESIPHMLEDQVLYISMEHCSAIHKCVCGCGNEIVTPLSPTDWQLKYDGTVTLRPSVGNWNIPCRSHYFITQNRVEYASSWEEYQKELNREVKPKKKKIRKRKKH